MDLYTAGHVTPRQRWSIEDWAARHLRGGFGRVLPASGHIVAHMYLPWGVGSAGSVVRVALEPRQRYGGISINMWQLGQDDEPNGHYYHYAWLGPQSVNGSVIPAAWYRRYTAEYRHEAESMQKLLSEALVVARKCGL